MNKDRENIIKNKIIFLLIFFIVIGILILLGYLGAQIQLFWLLIMMPVSLFAFWVMIFKDYARGIFPKRLIMGPTSSYITIKKHPIRAAINFIFWGSFYGALIIYFLIQPFIFLKNI